MPSAVTKGTASSEPEPELKTAVFDTRFPHMNQTRNCWQNYVDYHRCVKIKGENYSLCDYFKKTFAVVCPSEWISTWDDQREGGAFVGHI